MKHLMTVLGIAACLLPATWTSTLAQKAEVRNFHGTTIQKSIQLAWWSAGDATFVNQIVEYSTDGITFKPLVQLIPTGGTVGAIYQYLHSSPVVGTNYYRLALVFSDNSIKYSESVKIELGAPPVYTYPTGPSVPRPGSRPRQ